MLPILEIAVFSCGNFRYLSALAQDLADKLYGGIHQGRMLKVADRGGLISCVGSAKTPRRFTSPAKHPRMGLLQCDHQIPG
jgi:hypothetical protein